MTVLLRDKRKQKGSVSGLDISNGTWFAILSIKGMSDLVNTQKTNDTLNVTPATAKKMAVLIAGWIPPEYWAQGVGSQTMKLWLLEFLLTCNGFRTS
jgi:hypothetical protein